MPQRISDRLLQQIEELPLPIPVPKESQSSKIGKLRKLKKKSEYISINENIDYFIMIKALAISTLIQ